MFPACGRCQAASRWPLPLTTSTRAGIYQPRLQRHSPIGSSAGKHLVDTDDVEGVDADTHVERVLSARLSDVLVGTDTSSFQSFRSDLLVLVAYHVRAEGEIVNRRLLAAKIVDANLLCG